MNSLFVLTGYFRSERRCPAGQRRLNLVILGFLTFLISGAIAMSDTPPPNTTNPTTADDYNAVKALATAKADALDAQAKLIASQKALLKAQAGDDQTAAQLAAATQAAGIAAQQKALSDSQAAIRKNDFTVPDSGYTGDIKAGDKAGSIEASLLAARAINIAADRVAKRLDKKVNAGESVILYAGSDLPDFQSLISFRTQCHLIEQALDEAITKVDAARTKAQVLLPPRVEFVSPAVIGAAFDAANKILGFFRTDYSIQGVAVTVDDLLLINSLANVMTDKGVKIKLPTLYNASALLSISPVVAQLDSLTAKRVALQQKLNLAPALVDDLTAAAAKETDPLKKAKEVEAAANLKAASDEGKVTVSLYDGLLTKLTTPDDKAKLPLGAIIQQDAIRTALQNGSKLMTVKVSSTGGTYYTRKNLWSFFGTMPFFTMGGAVINYTLLDGNSGVVLSAGAIPIDGGFFKIHKLPQAINNLQ